MAGRSGNTRNQGTLRLPVVLYIPNLIGYVRILLSLYGLHVVVQSMYRERGGGAQYSSLKTGTAGVDDDGINHPHLIAASLARAAFHYVSQGLVGGGLMMEPSSLIGKKLEKMILSMGWTTSSASTSKEHKGIDPDRLAATLVFFFSALLDALDGYAARSLNQTSSLGIILDVIADNILRSCMWCASLLVNPSISLPAIIIITIEWLTLLSSQVAVLTEGGRHWKQQRACDPWVVRYFFSKDFRNPLGGLGIAGLFIAPILPFLTHSFPSLVSYISFYGTLCLFLYLGRLISLCVEGYFVIEFIKLLCEQDERGQGGGGGGERGTGGSTSYHSPPRNDDAKIR